jgi:CubicO group peptidase (beta-lactamase class C family)
MRRYLALALSLNLLLVSTSHARERVPGDHWMRYADPGQAGFDPSGLEAARELWEGLPSSAFLVVADGAVVAAWGDVDRRFMCHSVRKSFLSALYGIYWDRRAIELNKTLADLGLDDEPDPLLESEKRARILDLLKARSGVFHPAAYAGRTDSRPRGSEGPGRFFAYNNWDFNTLATILEMETGDSVFEAFDEHFARPLGMQDWRVSDGYFHYERDKSKYPAYPFRMSARDAARFGLLFARDGTWADERILSRHWVRRSTGLYSIDDDTIGYGFMWWVFLEPRFERYGMVAALGVGNQMIAALPDIDLVIVNRADTYADEMTPTDPLLDLVEAVLGSRTGEPVEDPRLVPLEDSPDPRITRASPEQLAELVGEWPYPPQPLGAPADGSIALQAGPGHLIAYAEDAGTFRMYVQPDGSWHAEDAHYAYLVVRDDTGAFTGICDANRLVELAMEAVAGGEVERARRIFAAVQGDEVPAMQVGRALLAFLVEAPEEAEDRLLELARHSSEIRSHVDRLGRLLAEQEGTYLALAVFELNTRLFPQAPQAWNSLAETQLLLEDREAARHSYQKSLALDPANEAARQALEQIR